MINKVTSYNPGPQITLALICVVLIVAMFFCAYTIGNADLRNDCAKMGGQVVYSQTFIPRPIGCVIR